MTDNVERTRGKDAQRQNIAVVHALAEDIRTTLGPKGMDKMIVDGLGDIIVTNDGYTILSEMRIQHPAARLAIEAAVAQQDRVGDGTTTVLVLAGELLHKAQGLLDMNIHPAVIAKMFRVAERMAQEILAETAETVTPDQDELLIAVAQTAMTGKGAETAKEHLAALAVQALRKIIRKNGAEVIYDDGNLKLERMVGRSLEDSELINGVLLMSRARLHPDMPSEIRNVKVALLDQALEIKNPEITTQIQISDPGQMQAFIEQEHRTLAEMTAKLIATGCTAVFCKQNIEEPADYFLSKAGILAVRRVPQSDLVRIAKATNAKIVSSPNFLDESALGFAGHVQQRRSNNMDMIIIEECKEPRAITLLITGGTDHAAEEARRAVEDAIGDLSSVMRTSKVVAGASAIEIRLKRMLRDRARKELLGKERLIVEAFADALLVIPKTLIESSGQDPVDVIGAMEKREEDENKWVGFNVITGEISDSWSDRIIEPLQIKTQAIASATEVAVMILRIDDMFVGATRDKG